MELAILLGSVFLIVFFGGLALSALLDRYWR